MYVCKIVENVAGHKGGVHIMGEICQRSDPDIAHIRYYLGPPKLKYKYSVPVDTLPALYLVMLCSIALATLQIWTQPYQIGMKIQAPAYGLSGKGQE